MEKHTPYFNLLDQLKAAPADCALCASLRSSLKSYLDTYLYEGVNDDTNWNRLAAAGGWCGRHGAELESFSDGLAVALFYRFLLRRDKSLAASQGSWFKKAAKPDPCPACAHESQLEEGLAKLFSGAWEHDEFRAAFEAGSGLCLPHQQAVALQLPPRSANSFVAANAAKTEALCLELDEIVRKSDHRSSEKMGSEGDAWKRALRRALGRRHPR